MKKKKLRFIILFTVIAFITAGTVTFLRSAVGRALLKSKKHFKPSSIDSRVLYEPGAEDYAEKIAVFLPEAIRRVEEGHYVPFRKPVKIYVYRTQESFSTYMAQPGSRVRGSALIFGVYIAPRAFNFRGFDTHKESLMHELSHLHLMRRLGYLGFGQRIKVPGWFSEGIANAIAGSGGEGISDGEAIDYIHQGKELILRKKGMLFAPFHANFPNMHGWMFHKQNRMFLNYIKTAHPEGLKKTMLCLYLGASFSDSFTAGFNMDIQTMWNRFKTTLFK
jgi:hypothetical protein